MNFEKTLQHFKAVRHFFFYCNYDRDTGDLWVLLTLLFKLKQRFTRQIGLKKAKPPVRSTSVDGLTIRSLLRKQRFCIKITSGIQN